MSISQHRLPVLSFVALVTAGVSLNTVPAVSAELSWDWSYKCSVEKCEGGSGTFTTTDQQGSGGNEYYVVTAMTGTVEGNTVTSLVAPDSLGQKNDNKISLFGDPYANGPSTVTGIAFLTNNDPATDENVNLLYSLYIDPIAGYDTQISGPNDLALENIHFSAKRVDTLGGTPVPEPSSFMVLITASILLLGMTFRKSFE